MTVSPEHAGAGGPGTVVSQALLGAAEGTRDVGVGIARTLVLNALTFGIYSGYELGGAILEGYEEGGILGALNAVNPLYHIGQGAADTALAIGREDYRKAGAAGTKTMILAAATVFGAGRGLGAAAEESATVASATRGPSLAARAEQVHTALHPVAQRMRTTAALDTTGGRIIAGGGPDLTPAQRALLDPGEIAATLPGAHAEATALAHAQQAGLTPQAMAVTRAICPQCANTIEMSGGTLTSPTTAIWPR
ncbi:hypothetical protein [Sorangium sp. So ce388]|uniref:hypothetical protein n=1 Tax=Sorangium sp. So ce388 TaxID=3133309 RepID=UPI003F5B70D9